MAEAVHESVPWLQRLRAPKIEDLMADCQAVANARPGDTNCIAGLLQKMILRYYSDVRWQARQSFWSALAAAVIGLLFFLYATAHAMSGATWPKTVTAMSAGGLSQFIAAVNFYLYFKAARQFASFHICLERTNRFLLANTMCENLEQPARDETRRKLIDVIANAPMLTLEAVVGKTEPAVVVSSTN